MGALAGMHDITDEGYGAAVREHGYVYFIRSVDDPFGPIKIGSARQPESRLASLQTGHPDELEILGVLPNVGGTIERELHELYARERRRGEWFNASPGLLQFIREETWPA